VKPVRNVSAAPGAAGVPEAAEEVREADAGVAVDAPEAVREADGGAAVEAREKDGAAAHAAREPEPAGRVEDGAVRFGVPVFEAECGGYEVGCSPRSRNGGGWPSPCRRW
jgi:hypothetical protein